MQHQLFVTFCETVTEQLTIRHAQA